MSQAKNGVNRQPRGRINVRRLLIVLAVGTVPTAICFLFNWWWVATAFLLLTLLGACFAFQPVLYPHVFTFYAFFAIAWVSGSWLNGALAPETGTIEGWRAAVPLAAGVGLGVAVPVTFWLVVLFVSAQWILRLSESLDVSRRDALRFVASQVFNTSQNYIMVENGQLAFERPRGIFSKLGGPGILVVRPGNAVVLERGGQTTRIVGPGTHQLKRFETVKKPARKGIINLTPQYSTGEAEGVMTRDGIPLKITIGGSWQVEPKEVTDLRPGSHFAGGEATTALLGTPEYPVYEEIIRKAVFRTTDWGVQGMFPAAPINILRDVVATYTLEELFSVDTSGKATPDPRTTRRIEETVNERFDPARVGVVYRGLDINKVEPPDDVKRQMLERWKAPLEGQVAVQRARAEGEARIEQAKAEREALLEISEGRARSIERLEGVRLKARVAMVRVIESLVNTLPQMDQEQVVAGFIRVIEQLTNRVGQDESVAMRYIETMQAIVSSEGPKSFVITPPNPSPGMLPPARQVLPPGRGKEKQEPKR